MLFLYYTLRSLKLVPIHVALSFKFGGNRAYSTRSMHLRIHRMQPASKSAILDGRTEGRKGGRIDRYIDERTDRTHTHTHTPPHIHSRLGSLKTKTLFGNRHSGRRSSGSSIGGNGYGRPEPVTEEKSSMLACLLFRSFFHSADWLAGWSVGRLTGGRCQALLVHSLKWPFSSKSCRRRCSDPWWFVDSIAEIRSAAAFREFIG